LVCEGDWNIRAVVEVKGFFDKPSLAADLNKLGHARQHYPTNPKSLFAFIGFVPWNNVSGKMKSDIKEFTREENNYAILPGRPDGPCRGLSLEEFLKRL
jgi:hypothetical protein